MPGPERRSALVRSGGHVARSEPAGPAGKPRTADRCRGPGVHEGSPTPLGAAARHPWASDRSTSPTAPNATPWAGKRHSLAWAARRAAHPTLLPGHPLGHDATDTGAATVPGGTGRGLHARCAHPREVPAGGDVTDLQLECLEAGEDAAREMGDDVHDLALLELLGEVRPTEADGVHHVRSLAQRELRMTPVARRARLTTRPAKPTSGGASAASSSGASSRKSTWSAAVPLCTRSRRQAGPPVARWVVASRASSSRARRAATCARPDVAAGRGRVAAVALEEVARRRRTRAARSKPPALRAEPRHGSTAVERTSAGRPSSSASRPATRPMTPTGQSPATTTNGASGAGRVDLARRARLARARRASTAPQRVGALELVRRAAPPPSRSWVASSAAAIDGSPTRPIALIRGASPKAMSSTLSTARSPSSRRGRTEMSAASPGREPVARRAQAESHDGSGSRRRGARRPRRTPMAARSASASAASAPPGRVGQEQLRDLEGDARAGQPRVGIAAVGPLRVDEREGPGGVRPAGRDGR